jgi:isopentenyl phosphate kinase
MNTAIVARGARRLNALVVDALLTAGLPALGLPGGAVIHAPGAEPVVAALGAGLVPVVYGDAVPAAGGGRIVSTEDLLLALAEVLAFGRVVLATDVDGVLREGGGELIAEVRPRTAAEAVAHVRSAGDGVSDVTGGMGGKLRAALRLVEREPATEVVIVNGLVPGRIFDALAGRPCVGTRVVAEAA